MRSKERFIVLRLIFYDHHSTIHGDKIMLFRGMQDLNRNDKSTSAGQRSKFVYDFSHFFQPLIKIACSRHVLLLGYAILTALLCAKNEIKFSTGKKYNSSQSSVINHTARSLSMTTLVLSFMVHLQIS